MANHLLKGSDLQSIIIEHFKGMATEAAEAAKIFDDFSAAIGKLGDLALIAEAYDDAPEHEAPVPIKTRAME